MPEQHQDPQAFDAIVVGAGFAGLYQLHRLRAEGFRVRVLEAGDGVGGTWHWNRYPGARCDVESMHYSYSFSPELEQEWIWTERYPAQPEILRYLNHVADRFDLRRDIQLDTRVTSAHFDEDAQGWLLRTEAGETFSARFIVMATGCLSAPKPPAFKGLETFAGDWYHTGAWPHTGVDFTGKRVAVIGTGSTGIQSIPVIAKTAARVTVFQRTPNFSIPAANGPLSPEQERAFKDEYQEWRRRARESAFGIIGEVGEDDERSAFAVSDEERREQYERCWNERGFRILVAYGDLLLDPAANDTAADFVRDKIRSIVEDAETAEKLVPKDHPIGTKRLCVDTDYYATYNRDNVELVDLRATPLEEITREGVRTTQASYPADIIVFAIGFDAMTGALLNIDIRGRDGQELQERWADGPRTYLGLQTAGFPNLFMITGPQSPSVLSNMVVSIEQHVDWITDALVHLRDRGIPTVEATVEAQDAWVQHVVEVGDATLFPLANSWYVGANVPGKPRVFMPYVGGVGTYRQACDEVAAKGYEGFALGAPEPQRA
jgi:cation diffusion facilitator CzcD-associated flavoprotein CzcO